MWKLFIIPLLAVSFQAWGQNDTLNRTDQMGRKTGYWISKDASGLKTYEGFFREGRPAGRFLRYHANGKTRAEMNYLPDGSRVEARLFDPEGRLRAEGTYKNQRRDGLWSYYSEKKLPIYRIRYTDGQVDGEAIRFGANGSPLEQTRWIRNKLDGLQVIYFPDQKPQAMINYRDGTIHGPYQLLYPDGKPEVQGFYTAGLKTGRWEYFLPNGDHDYILEYEKGKLLNPEILDARRKESFDRYEKNRNLLRDPQDFINNPDEYLGR